MWRITWHENGEQKSMKVHSARTVEEVLKTFDRDTRQRYRHVQVQRVSPTRFRELVIKVAD